MFDRTSYISCFKVVSSAKKINKTTGTLRVEEFRRRVVVFCREFHAFEVNLQFRMGFVVIHKYLMLWCGVWCVVLRSKQIVFYGCRS
jgi:hypothetical protein